jgi:hypothetical protein
MGQIIQQDKLHELSEIPIGGRFLMKIGHHEWEGTKVELSQSMKDLLGKRFPQNLCVVVDFQHKVRILSGEMTVTLL